MTVNMVNVSEAKTHFSRLLERVAAGEEIIIARAGVPVARLVSIESTFRARVPGRYIGKIRIREDFDAPLPPDVLDAFRAS